MSRVTVAFHIPMHRYEVCEAERYEELMGNPDWWGERAAIWREYLAPCWAQQTCRDFELLLTLRPDEAPISVPMVEAAADCGAIIAFERWRRHPWPLGPQYYNLICDLWGRGESDWLILVHCAGDDLYSIRTVEMLHNVTCSDGLILWWAWGYLFGTQNKRLVAIGSDNGPQAFYAEVYSAEALQCAESFAAYRERWSFDRYHYQMPTAPVNSRMPDGHFCQLLHDANVGSAWDHQHTVKKMGAEIGGDERADILARFAIDAELLTRLGALGYA